MLKTSRVAYLWVLLAFFCPDLQAIDFIRGDSNGDGEVNISDAQHCLQWLFLAGSEPECLAAADTNDDEGIDITDPIRTLEFLFLAGEEPPPPFLQPGSDPTPGLGCGPAATLEFSCRVRGPLVELAWEFEGEADSFELRRNGEPVAELAAGVQQHTDGPGIAGNYDYELIAQMEGDLVAQASCAASGVEDNAPPTLEVLSPQQGAIISGRSFNLRLGLDDDTGIGRLLIDGEEVELPLPLALPATLRVNLPGGRPGPRLVRILSLIHI